MPSVALMKRTLTGSFVASSPITITNEDLTLFVKATTSGGPTVIEFYLEYTDANPLSSAAEWFREVDEEDTGAGEVSHAEVIRTFNDNTLDTGLSDGVHRLTLQFSRRAPFARVQMKVSDGAAAVVVSAPYGSTPNAP